MQSNGSCALPFSMMRSIHLWSFKVVALILYEIWSGHKLDGQTDGRTHRQRHFLMPPPPSIFNAGGIKTLWQFLSGELLHQFQPDSLDTWHKYKSRVVDIMCQTQIASVCDLDLWPWNWKNPVSVLSDVLLLQFQPDSLYTWHKNQSGVLDVQDPNSRSLRPWPLTLKLKKKEVKILSSVLLLQLRPQPIYVWQKC